MIPNTENAARTPSWKTIQKSAQSAKTQEDPMRIWHQRTMWACTWIEDGKLSGIRIICFVEESVIRYIPCGTNGMFEDLKNER
jgi:hypothetical protein